MSEIKIRVSTHDNDTTDIELSRIGTKLKVSLGDKKAEIDIAEFIPAIMADRFLADATYDENTKELVLITRKEGEEDKEFRVPISHIFQVEVEEILSKSEVPDVDFPVYVGYKNYPSINASALGKIKGTDWYVFKFDEVDVNRFKSDIATELSKRDMLPSDVTGFDENSIAVVGNSAPYHVKPNVETLILNNLTELKQSATPSRFLLKVNGTTIGGYYQNTEGAGVFNLGSTYSFETSDEVLNVELVDPDGNDGRSLIVHKFTTSLTNVKRVFKEFSYKEAGNYNNVLKMQGSTEYPEAPVTVVVDHNLDIVKNIANYKTSDLPHKIDALVDEHVMATYTLQADEQGQVSYVKEVHKESVQMTSDFIYSVNVYYSSENTDAVYNVRLGHQWILISHD